MTDDETIASVLLRANQNNYLDVVDVNILCNRISQLKASNEMATEHMTHGRVYLDRLEAELDQSKIRIQQLEGALVTHRASITTLEARDRQMLGVRNDLQDKLSEAEKQIESLRSRIDSDDDYKRQHEESK